MICLPINAVGSGQDVFAGDESGAAVEAILLLEGHHPGEFVGLRHVAADHAQFGVRNSANYEHTQYS